MPATVHPIRPPSLLEGQSPRGALVEVGQLQRNTQLVLSDATGVPPRARPQTSGQLESIWGALEVRGIVKRPMYDPYGLATFPHISTILPQCIRALRVGIHGFGFGFESAVDPREEQGSQALQKLMAEERKRGDRFFKYSHPKKSFTSQRFALATDMFTVGWAGLEVLRDTRTLRAVGLEHVPAVTLRIGFSDPEPVLVRRKVLSEDGKRFEVRTSWERMRRYVQIHNNKMAFFKEISDPRFIDRHTGEVVKPVMELEDYANPRAARELLWFSDYDPADPHGYGSPPWIGTMIQASGERKADEVNWSYFDNKAVPSMAVLVSGGALRAESAKRIKEDWKEIKGIENFWKILLLEAEPFAEGTAADLAPGRALQTKVELQPLTQAQEKDALFQGYKRTARDNVRSACGLSPIFTGESQDYTRATALTAMQVAETFMFGPLRNEFDDSISRLLLPELELRYWWFRSGTPDLTNIEDLARVIEVGNKAGVGNPNVYSKVLERVLGTELPQSDEPWAQFPVDLVKIALQSGMVTLSFEDGQLNPQVHEEARERFKNTVGQVLETAIERVLLRAREMAS